MEKFKYFLKCGDVVEAEPDVCLNGDGRPVRLLPVLLARRYVEKRQKRSFSMPDKCRECPVKKFTTTRRLVDMKNTEEIYAAIDTICYAVRDPEYDRKVSDVVKMLLKAARQERNNNAVEFLESFVEQKFTPYKSYKGSGFEPTLTIGNTVYLSGNSDKKIMDYFNIREETLDELAEETGRIYDEEAHWAYWPTEEACQQFIDKLYELTKLDAVRT